MSKLRRRDFLKISAKLGIGVAVWESLLQKALAIEAHNATRSINDVEHIVILMQENRSFDHYFGAMRGVRGFGDRFPLPLESGQRVFHQSDGKKIVAPYRADGKLSNAAFVNGTPHNFPDTQAAWNQGKYGFWPLFKTDYPPFNPVQLKPGQKRGIPVSLQKSSGWYDFTVRTADGFSQRFAGRVETGRQSISDPAMAAEL